MPNKRSGINLLDPINPPVDLWTNIYNWVFKVGRYLLVGIEIMLLGVFFARFVLDELNNDLSKKINDKVTVLSNKEFRAEEIRFKNMNSLLLDINQLGDSQSLNSSVISQITSGIPSGLTLKSFSYKVDRVSLTIETSDLTAIKNYEFSLRQNVAYSNVVITISKNNSNGSQMDVTVAFNINSKK